jgi:serine phosphatase RsbU (regulator of sigma subunit)
MGTGGVASPDAGDELSIGERATIGLLDAAHLTAPERLTELLIRHAAPVGITDVTVYLADLRHVALVPLESRERGEKPVLRIDATLAGRAFRTLTEVNARQDDGHRVWLPLIDGTVRLGVLELTMDSHGDLSQTTLARCRILAQITGLLIISKGPYSDTFARLRRREPMDLSAELEWALMPPQTVATGQVVVTAALEPAYRVGGDAYDFSLVHDEVHLSLFDAAGHDLTAGMVASIAMAASRNTRRSGGHLTDIALLADHALAQQNLDERFVTAILGVLDLLTGRLTWVNCGHPPPLLIRHERVVKELSRPPGPPIGLLDGEVPDVHTENLEPGDRLLLYTDGVVEARTADGDLFGLQRLADAIIRTTAAGITAPEALRRLVHGLLAEHADRLTDDATIMLVEWRPEDPDSLAGQPRAIDRPA